MPNSAERVHEGVAPLSRHAGLSTMLNSPLAPVKSRCQMAWPGSLLERRMQHARHLRPLFEPAREGEARTRGAAPAARPSVRRPRSARIHVVRADAEAERVHGALEGGQASPRWPTTQPNMMSEWPPIYLVPAWIERSTPCVEGAEIERRRPGIVHQHQRAFGMRRPRRSPGCPASRSSASRAPRRTPPCVFGLISLAMPSPMSGS